MNQPRHMIYGIHPVRETLESGHLRVERLWIGAGRPQPALQAVIDLARRMGVPTTFSTREELDRMVQGGAHQSVVGAVQEFPYENLDTLLRRRKEGKPVLIVVLDGIQDPQNLGAIIRTALGSGAQGVIIPKDRAAGMTASAVKASAGAAVHLPIVQVVNIANTLDRLKAENIWVYGAAGEAKDRIYELDLTTDLAIVIGSEGKGIRPLVRKKCDRLFSIPMVGPLSSFNASVSGAMILYEVTRQRTSRNKETKSC